MKHLYEGTDNYGMPLVWCGDESFEYSTILAEVNCERCLTLASELGSQAKARLNWLKITSTFPPLSGECGDSRENRER
jgi:hypothetical protein